MNLSIKTVITYLTTHNYPHEISPKILSSPTGKDFLNIVSFLAQRIDTSFIITKGNEDDIPNLFKSLKYPFQISKKGLASVAAPHTWPCLLGSLVWLVELLTYMESNDSVCGSDFQNSENEAERLFFDFTVRAYGDFLEGEDDFSPLQSELEQIFEAKNEVIKKDIQNLISMKEQMMSEIEHLTNEPNRIENLTLQKNTFTTDVSKFKTLVDNLEKHKQTIEIKNKELQKEFDSRLQEIENVRLERSQLLETIDSQELNAVDVERMNNEKSTLEEQLSSIANQKESTEKHIFEKEIQISKKLEDVDRIIQQFNITARKLKIIPLNSKFAKGVNYQLTFSSHSPDLIVDQIKGVIKPSLDQLIEELSKSVTTDKEELLTLREKIDKFEESTSDKKDEIINIENKTKKLETSYKKEKERMKDQLKQKQMEIENIHQDINRIKDASADSLAQSNKSVETLRQEFDDLSRKFITEKEEINSCVVQTLDMLASHKAYIQENLGALQKYYIQVRGNLSK